MKIDIATFEDTELSRLVDNRWESSKDIWDTIEKVYKQNTAIYENKGAWLDLLPERRRNFAVQANRIFVNVESVINAVIANPPGLNMIPTRDGELAQQFARRLESYLRKKFTDLNTKETVRMANRNLYFGRLFVIKAFWNPVIDDFDFRSIEPNKVRFSKFARKEQDSEFAIEEIDDNLCALCQRFPTKKDVLMKKYGITDEADLYIKNPDVKYKESWIQDYVVFKLEDIVLGKIKNPYWDWEGVLITEDEEEQLDKTDASGKFQGLEGPARRDYLQAIKLDQESRKASMQQEVVEMPEGEIEPSQGATGTVQPQSPKYKPYFFNYFDAPRKPYIFATLFNNENKPIGRTDMITLSSSLQRGIDKRKCDIDENAELVNGILKVDATVMSKAEAQRIRFETKGIIWGKNVKNGVSREMGTPLPQFVFEDMVDSRQEIDNIMAATSAFRGVREGQETKAGRLALIQQSFLRLNELVQVNDFVAQEMFSWALQLAKTRYTEPHYAKWVGKEGAREVIDLMQDDLENGLEAKVIAGKSLPIDDEFRFEQAQVDFKQGALGLTDYLEAGNYDDPKTKAQNAVKYHLAPVVATGISEQDAAALKPKPEEKPPSVSIGYSDLPPDAQLQLLAKIGIQANPAILIAEKMATQKQVQDKSNLQKK